MKKLLLLLCLPLLFSTCKKEEEVIAPTVINGCTDTIATNYNPLATVDDISCIYTKAIVIVKNSNGAVIPNATVKLYPDATISNNGSTPNPSLTKTNNTDANGQVEFIYKWEAILNIDVVKLIGNDTLVGSNIIRLIEGVTVTKIVEIN